MRDVRPKILVRIFETLVLDLGKVSEKACEDDRLPTDYDITSSDSETEQNDLTSDENIVSGSDRNDA